MKLSQVPKASDPSDNAGLPVHCPGSAQLLWDLSHEERALAWYLTPSVLGCGYIFSCICVSLRCSRSTSPPEESSLSLTLCPCVSVSIPPSPHVSDLSSGLSYLSLSRLVSISELWPCAYISLF